MTLERIKTQRTRVGLDYVTTRDRIWMHTRQSDADAVAFYLLAAPQGAAREGAAREGAAERHRATHGDGVEKLQRQKLERRLLWIDSLQSSTRHVVQTQKDSIILVRS
ncbi:uncharacterized protein V6R79_005345 [Siganus canaliculatus]